MKLTKNDIAKKRARIAELEAELSKLRKERSEQGRFEKVDVGFNYYPSQVLYNQRTSIIMAAIKKEEADIRDAEIVDELTIPENLVGLGDTITLLLQYDGEPAVEQTYLLTSMPEIGTPFITATSPIGAAVYGKEIGTVVKCKTPIGQLSITILEKNPSLKR